MVAALSLIGCRDTALPTAGAAKGPCASPQPAPLGPITLTSGGIERSYLLSLPDPAPTKPAPLIVNLHGSGSNASQQAAYSSLAVKGPERGFVVVTPNATGQPQQWDVYGTPKVDDVAFVDDLLADVATRACVDPTRTFAAGLSSGAAMSSLLACEQGDRFRAIAPVSAVIFFPPVCTNGPPVTVIAFHGTADAVVPYAGGPIFGVGGSVRYPGVAQGMSGWATRAHCASTPQTTPTTAHVTLEQWTGCAAGTTVELYTINGGGHTWPGAFPVPLLGPTTSEISATNIILDAFSRA